MSESATQEPSPAGLTAVSLLVAGTFFMENLDATVITPAIPHMADSFGVAPVALNTGVSAYMLTLGIFIPVSGWLAKRFGARSIFTAAIALFTLASLLCGLAQTLPQFILFRILQGIGGAMMVPVGRLIVLRATPKHRLIATIATLTWPALIAPVLGPPLGGLIADHISWPWIFYLNLPLGLIALIAALVLVPRTLADRSSPFDWLGFLLSGAALFCLMYAAESLAAPQISWQATLALAAAGIALLLWAARHFRLSPHPMVDLGALKIQTFAVCLWGGSLFRMGVSAIPFLLPLMFQIGFGYSAFEAGIMLMAVFAGNLLIKPATTSILRRFGFRRVLLGNGLLNAAAIACCALITRDTPLALSCLILFIGGMTRSMQFTALNTVAFGDVPQPAMTAANTLFSAAFQLSMGLGIALGAIAWRLGGWLATPSDSSAAPFHIAFLIVAAVSLIGLWDCLKLSPRAGEHLAAPPRRAS